MVRHGHDYAGGAGFVGRGVNADHKSRALLRSCVFSHNRAGSDGGGAVFAEYDFTEVAFEQCTFIGNCAYSGGALRLEDNVRAVIRNCTFSGNWSRPLASWGGALWCGRSVDVTIENTIVAFSSRGAGIACRTDPRPVVELSCCDVYGNVGGDWVGQIAEQRGINGNIWGDPGFCDTLNGNFAIQASSPCMADDLLGCGLIGAHGDGCSGEVWVVDPQGGADFTTIQEALSSCYAWDIVQLSDDVYSGTGNRDLEVPSIPITIRSESGDPSACLIDCEGDPFDPHRAFTFAGGVGQEAILRGVGITGGRAALGAGGGAIYCPNASPRLAGCLLFHNNGASRGGGAYCDSSAFPALLRCTISGNQATYGGALYFADSAGAMVQASILSFSPGGGAIGCDAGAGPSLSCSDVYGNVGGDWSQTCIADQRDLRWNFGVDPCFCGEEADDYTLHEDSPCAGTWGACGVIGAMQIGCGLGQCEQPQVSGILDWCGTQVLGGRLRSVPGPFPVGGRITYTIRAAEAPKRVVLTLYDVAGRLVCPLIDAVLTSGEHSVTWDGTSGMFQPVPAGVYFCRLSIGGRSETMPLVLVR